MLDTQKPSSTRLKPTRTLDTQIGKGTQLKQVCIVVCQRPKQDESEHQRGVEQLAHKQRSPDARMAEGQQEDLPSGTARGQQEALPSGQHVLLARTA